MTTGQVGVPLELVLAPVLFQRAAPGIPDVRARVEGELSALAAELGVPARPSVTVAQDAAESASGCVRLYASGTLCPVADSVVAEALAYVTGTPVVTQGAPLGPVLGLWGGTGPVDPGERFAELVALVCRQAVSDHPGALLPDDPLRSLLDLGVSLRGHDLDLLRDTLPDVPLEDLADAVSSPTIDLFVEPAYLRYLTEEYQGQANGFRYVRDELFAELGLPIPPFRLRPDPALRPRGFTVSVQGVRCVPRIGLAPGTILVNDTAERLRLMDIEAEASTNPAADQPAALVSAEYQETLRAVGLALWDPLGNLVLAIADVIRRRAHTLMTGSRTAAVLEMLGRECPVLAGAGNTLPNGGLTRVLRELLADEVPIRNLRLVVERVLRYETDPEAKEYSGRLAFVRCGLAEQIAAQAARNGSTIVVHLVDPAIEDAVRNLAPAALRDPSLAPLVERLHAAVATEMGYLPPTARVPALLTHDDVRRPLGALLRHRFPRVRVLAYGDLPAHYTIQPVARVSWS